MCKKFILIGLLVLCVGAMSMDAHAGLTGFKLNLGSLECDGSVTGIPKGECPDGNSTCTVACILQQVQASCNCLNPAGQDGGQGSVFFGGALLAGETFLSDTGLQGFGKEPASVPISDQQIIDSLTATGVCEDPNPGWSLKTVTNACQGDSLEPDGHPRAACIITSTQMSIIFTDADGNETTKLYQCDLDPTITLAGAPLCAENFPVSPYSCGVLRIK